MAEIVPIREKGVKIPKLNELMALKDRIPHSLPQGNVLLDAFIRQISGRRMTGKELSETWVNMRNEAFDPSTPETVLRHFDHVYFSRFIQVIVRQDVAEEANAHLYPTEEIAIKSSSTLFQLLRRFL